MKVSRRDAWWLILLALVTALAFWLRWQYARDVSYYVDEYLHLRAADRILQQGVPLLPSGNFYSHGLFVSYVEAVVLALGGREPWAVRLPLVLLSTAAVPLAFWFGRRAFRSAPAGLLAAALLAVAPEAVLWGGRVRMYGPLQFWVLAATTVFFLWVVERDDRPVYRILFVVTYWAALLCHAEAMLLLPIWGVWALLQRGWRWLLRPANLGAFVLSGVAPAAEILLRRLGPPVQARVAQGVLEPQVRQYLGAGLDWAGVQKVIEPLLLAPSRLPVVLLALGGLVYLTVSWLSRHRWRRSGDMTEHRSLAYLLALLVPVLALLLFAVSPEWKSPRYGLMLLPHLFLAAGGVAAVAGRGALAWMGRRWSGLPTNLLRAAATTVAIVLVFAASWPAARAVTQESVPGYDWAFGYVAEHEQPGDVVVTFLCPAAFWHLGRCDYLAIPQDFAGFAVEEDGRWVSGWDGVPLLDGGDALRRVLAEAPRVWLVVDEGRFARRYEPDFLQAVDEGMVLVAAEEEVLVFRYLEGEPPPAPEP